MRSDAVPQQLLATCLAIGMAATGMPAWASGALNAPSRIGQANYDAAHQWLAVPVTGKRPQVHFFETSPRHYVLDMATCELAKDEVQGQSVQGSTLAGWSLAATPQAETVRLRLTMQDDVVPTLGFVAANSSYVVSFKPAAPADLRLANRSLPPMAPGVPRVPTSLRLPSGVSLTPNASHDGVATLGTPRFDAARGCLVVPVRGDVDPRLSVVKLAGKWAYLDVPNSHPSFGGVRYQNRTTRLLERWVMAKRPHSDTTRLAFALSSPTAFDIKLAGHEILVGLNRPVQSAHAKLATPPKLATVKTGTTLGQPFYDRKRFSLVLPYLGPTPLYRFDSQQPLATTLEVQGTRERAIALVQSFSHHPLISKWQVEPEVRPGTVRVALSFRVAADVVVTVDDVRHQLLFIPQPRAAVANADATMPARVAVLEAAKLPADGHSLYVPYQGQAPAYSVDQLDPTMAYVDFPNARMAREAVQFFAPNDHPTLRYCLVTQRPDHSVRLALALTQPGGPAVYQDRTHQRLVIELGAAQTAVGVRTETRQPAAWSGELGQPVLGQRAP